ncbi:hypothetical protein [Nocardioides antri]|uniref:Uncharacterized protein n=1 Tax=Nocardioides antri TaxID=2607659 RepID=A0A5B1M1D5_9ACTN|nr:hypothetical protein [Nocardioides antri]KAA1426733.1 hypothetical protein F0U47_12215 [Nocardioides antri]
MPDTETTEMILGVNIVAGGLWFGCVDGDGTQVEDRDDRLRVDYDMLGEARALSELEHSLEAHLTRLGPAAIALLDAGTSNQARAVHVAHRRGQVEAVVLIAAERAGVPITRVTHAAVKKRFDVAPTKPALRSKVAEALGITAPTNWASRAPATAAALVVAAGPADE